MTDNKTQFADATVRGFLDGISHPTRQADARVLNDMFQQITGWQPRMVGPTIIGYGSYHYTYDSGREGDCQATGFSPRKASLSIYIMPGYADFGHILDRLGKHKIGKPVSILNKLADVDMDVLAN